jgi:cobalamin biosynthesis protein CbiD
MRIDLYTKTVLTVIAVCLVWMCINGATPVAWAQADKAQPSRVILVNEEGVPLFTSDGLRVNVGTEALPVSVRNTVPVAVRSLQRVGRWDPLEVHVLREPPTLAPIP